MPLGGLAVIDLEAVGGVKLTSDAYELRSCPSRPPLSNDIGQPGNDLPAKLNVGSYWRATVLVASVSEHGS